MYDSDDVPPVLMLGFAPDERSKERRCISSHECKVLADSYGFQHRDVDYDQDMTPILQKMVADIRRDEYEAVEESASIPLVDMVVLGDVFVGKTSLVNRLLSGEFESKYVSSGATRPRKVKVIVDDALAVLRLRDTPGESYQSIINSDVMHVVHSAVILYDCTSRATFETAQVIRRMILTAKQEKRLSIVLVGNKSDEQFMVPRQVSYEEGLALARTWKCPFFEVSCKQSNVDHIFKEAIREYRLIFNYDLISSPKAEWSGVLQMNTSGKFQKKYATARQGKFTYSSKQDSSKSKSIDLNSNVGVIEGNHEKGALLILSVIGITPHIQCLLPTIAERSALADALFAELAFQHAVEDLLTDAVKTAITSIYEPEDSHTPLCILAHGRLPSSANVQPMTQPGPAFVNSQNTGTTSTPTSSPSNASPLASSSPTLVSTPFKRSKI